jgi:hypothetical protein
MEIWQGGVSAADGVQYAVHIGRAGNRQPIGPDETPLSSEALPRSRQGLPSADCSTGGFGIEVVLHGAGGGGR